ncbi:hypothetical protein B0D78_05900 [Pyramidobacter sp. C12-8]|nr:hypothetical protein B0D78_05900 [Pyramidobacter sp. C12-8]
MFFSFIHSPPFDDLYAPDPPTLRNKTILTHRAPPHKKRRVLFTGDAAFHVFRENHFFAAAANARTEMPSSSS